MANEAGDYRTWGTEVSEVEAQGRREGRAVSEEEAYALRPKSRVTAKGKIPVFQGMAPAPNKQTDRQAKPSKG